jgi:hypothetical protein
LWVCSHLSLWPVAAFPYKIGQLFQPDAVNIIKPVLNCTVNINDGDHLSVHYNGHNHLAAAVPITGDLGNKLCLPRGCRRPANSSPKGNSLACYLALKRSQDELRLCGCRKRVESVEAGPVDGVGWRREGFVGMPEEGRRVGEVAGGVLVGVVNGYFVFLVVLV